MSHSKDYRQMSLEQLKALAHTDINAAFEHMHRMRLLELKTMPDHELEAIAHNDLGAAMELFDRYFSGIEADAFLEDYLNQPI